MGLKFERYLSHLTPFVSGVGVVSGVLDEGWGLYCESAEIGKCLPVHPLLVFVCESLLPLYAPYLKLFSACKRFNSCRGLPFEL